MYCFFVKKKNRKNAASYLCYTSTTCINLLNHVVKVKGIDCTADFDNSLSRMDNFDKFFKTGKISCNTLKYVLGMAKAAYQGQLEGTETKRKYADESYRGKKIIEFSVQLVANQYTNFNNTKF